MKLDTFIAKCICAFPSLYYKESYEASKIAVLDHTFLTIGNGIEYNADGTFGGMQRRKLPKHYTKRIRAGEKIVDICKIKEFDSFAMVKMGAYPDYSAKETVMFLADFLATKKPYYSWGEKVKGKVKDWPVVSIHPNLDDAYPWRPYPFSLEYCPFYNRNTKKFIAKRNIKADWREGIVYIFTKAKQWFESDAWTANDYYNWGSKDNFPKIRDNMFLEKYNKVPSLTQLCRDYEIPFKNYGSAQEMAEDICAIRRKQYLADCEKVIAFYR